MSSEVFSALEKFSEGNAAHSALPVGCDSPLQMVTTVSVWRTFFLFELAGLDLAAHC